MRGLLAQRAPGRSSNRRGQFIAIEVRECAPTHVTRLGRTLRIETLCLKRENEIVMKVEGFAMLGRYRMNVDTNQGRRIFEQNRACLFSYFPLSHTRDRRIVGFAVSTR